MLNLRSFFVKALLLLILSLNFKVFAQDSGDVWVLTNPEAPFVIIDDKREMSGYLVDVVDGILNLAGIKQEILAAPWERVEREARTKSNVLIFALARTDKREQNYHWITPLTANVYSVFSLTGEKDRFNHVADLATVNSIAVLENDVRHKIMLQANLSNIHVYPSWQDAIDGVISGRSEAIFFSEPGVQFFCKRQGKDCNGFRRVFMYQKLLSYLTLSKAGTDPALSARLKAAAIEFKQSAAFEKIAQHWLVEYENHPIPMHLEEGVLNLWNQ